MGHLCRTAIRGGSGRASARCWLSSELLLWPLLEGFFAIGLTEANGADKKGDMMGESRNDILLFGGFSSSLTTEFLFNISLPQIHVWLHI